MSKIQIDCNCELCSTKKAKYDAKHKIYGCWAYMCSDCYESYGSKVKGLFNIINDEVE